MYASVSCGEIDGWDALDDNQYILEVVLMRKNNIRMPVWIAYSINKDWIIYDFTPHVILTEKCNCLIYQQAKEKKNLINRYDKELSCYNITKFTLLKQIVSLYLVDDLLKVIVDCEC